MSAPTTPDKKKTKDHPRRYGSKTPRKNSIHKAEVEPWLTTTITTVAIKRGKSGRTLGVPKINQVAVLTAILSHRGWDASQRRPTRECRVSAAKISKLLEVGRETVSLAIQALENQGLLTRIPGGWQVAEMSDRPTIQGDRDVGRSDNFGEELSDRPTYGATNPLHPPSGRVPRGGASSLRSSSAASSSLRSESSASESLRISATAAAAKPPAGRAGGATHAAAAYTVNFFEDEENDENDESEEYLSKEKIEELRRELDEKIGRDSYRWIAETEDHYPRWETKILFEEERKKTVLIAVEVRPASIQLGIRIGEDWSPLWNFEELQSETRKVKNSLPGFSIWDYLIALEKRVYEFTQKRKEVIGNPVGFLKGVVTRDLLTETTDWSWRVLGFVYPKSSKSSKKKRKKNSKAEDAPVSEEFEEPEQSSENEKFEDQSSVNEQEIEGLDFLDLEYFLEELAGPPSVHDEKIKPPSIYDRVARRGASVSALRASDSPPCAPPSDPYWTR